jgi:hypothetical protein
MRCYDISRPLADLPSCDPPQISGKPPFERKAVVPPDSDGGPVSSEYIQQSAVENPKADGIDCRNRVGSGVLAAFNLLLEGFAGFANLLG